MHLRISRAASLALSLAAARASLRAVAESARPRARAFASAHPPQPASASGPAPASASPRRSLLFVSAAPAATGAPAPLSAQQCSWQPQPLQHLRSLEAAHAARRRTGSTRASSGAEEGAARAALARLSHGKNDARMLRDRRASRVSLGNHTACRATPPSRSAASHLSSGSAARLVGMVGA